MGFASYWVMPELPHHPSDPPRGVIEEATGWAVVILCGAALLGIVFLGWLVWTILAGY